MSAITASSNQSVGGSQIRRQLQERKQVAQIGRVILMAMMTITAVVYLIVPVVAINWMQTPFVSTFVEFPLTVNDGVLGPFFGGSSQNITVLHDGDTIVAVGGQAVRNAHQFNRVLREAGIGAIIEFEVIDTSGESATRLVELRPMPVNQVFVTFAIPYMVGLVYIGVGLWVYRNRRDHPIGRLFLITCLAIALVLGTVFDLWTTHYFANIWTASVALSAGFLLAFGMIFPTEVPVVARNPRIIFIPIVFMTGVMLIGQLFLIRPNHDTTLLVWQIHYILTGLSILFFIALQFVRSLFANFSSHT